jgi:hypothetical protein
VRPEQLRSECNSLCVVAGTRRDDTRTTLVVSEPGDPDVCATQLERTGPLQALAFEADRAAHQFGEGPGTFDRRTPGDVTEEFTRRFDVGEPYRAGRHLRVTHDAQSAPAVQ